MELCPRCRRNRHKYAFRCRQRFTYIQVACEYCGYEGPEVPMSHPKDSAAAQLAADQWNKAAVAVILNEPKPTVH